MWVLGGHWRLLTWDLKNQVSFYVINILDRPQGSYPENFLLISFLEVCQEWGVLYVGTLKTWRVPDQVLGRHGHSWHIESTWFTLRNIPWKFRLNILLFDWDKGSWIWPLKSVHCVGSGISVHCGSNFRETLRFWWFYHILCVVWRPIRKTPH